MTRDDVRAFLDGRGEHWGARDPVALAADHHDDGVVHSPVFGTIRGRVAIEATYRELFKVFPDWTYEEEEAVIEGDRAVQLGRAYGTHSNTLFGVQASGRRFEIHGVLVLELKDRKIARERRLYDFTGMLLQLGVIKAKT